MPINNESLNWQRLRGLAAEWKIINQFYYSDYYPLTEWNRSDDKWRGWEFFDSDQNSGFLQVFRSGGKIEEQTLKLYGLREDALYVLTDFDAGNSVTASGAELMTNGLHISIPNENTAVTVYIGTESIELPDYGPADEPRVEYEIDMTVPEGALQLSDIEWKSWKMYQSSSDNPNSPYKPSRDSDEQGNTLCIGAYRFKKGLRTHVCEDGSPARFVYDISAYDYTTFRAVVGKENTGGSIGNIQFAVYADGKPVALSPVLAAGEACMLEADITGASELVLLVYDGKDGIPYDSAGFGNPILYNAAGQ